MQINFGSRAVSCKIVYYGPGLSGKTTNIQKIHDQMPSDRRGDLTSIKTKGDRTLFFDFMALDLGKVVGMDTRFQIYTVPGQVYYNATRKLVLQGADGIVFVADSAPDSMQANVESWQNLQDNLAERGITTHDLPVVIQWNKRDIPGAVPTDEMNRTINTIGAPTFEAIACRGDGVLKTLKCVCALVCKSINTGPAGSSTSPKADTLTASVRPAPEVQATPADRMRFVSRRTHAVTASGSAVASATAVVDPESSRRSPDTTPTPPTVTPAHDGAPVPPKPQRRTTSEVFGPSPGPARAGRGPMIVAAAILAAAAATAALLHTLGVW